VLQLQAEQPVIGIKHRQAQLLGKAEGDPLVAAAAQGGRRAGLVGDAAVAAAKDQDLDELVEDDPVGDAAPVAAERVVDLTSGQQRGELDPQWLQDCRWQGRHESSGCNGSMIVTAHARLLPVLRRAYGPQTIARRLAVSLA
jgi:hypothetical protein